MSSCMTASSSIPKSEPVTQSGTLLYRRLVVGLAGVGRTFRSWHAAALQNATLRYGWGAGSACVGWLAFAGSGWIG